MIFGFDKQNIQLWVRTLEKILFSAWGHELELPIRQIRHRDEWIAICPELKDFIVDATERSIQRPKGKIKQKKYYSGKKKHYSVKNQLYVSPTTKRILSISKTVEGKLHDKKLFDQDKTPLYFPPGTKGMGDKGYEGTQKSHPYLTMTLPKKKPPGRDLTKEEQQRNKAISSMRVRVEHPIAYLKHFNILSHKYRSKPEKADLPFRNIAAIYNFTIPPT